MSEIPSIPTNTPRIGERWRHVRRGTLYLVKGLCLREDNLEWQVLYQAAGSGFKWCRPVSEFMDGRFELVERPTRKGTGRIGGMSGQKIYEAMESGLEEAGRLLVEYRTKAAFADKLAEALDGRLLNILLGLVEDGVDETVWQAAHDFIELRDQLLTEYHACRSQNENDDLQRSMTNADRC